MFCIDLQLYEAYMNQLNLLANLLPLFVPISQVK